jgi:hypothetical protein
MVKGEAAIMNEIYQRGPVSCSIAVTEALVTILEGSLLILLEDCLTIMKLVLPDGEKRMDKNIGSLEILGEVIGAKVAISA